MTLKFKIALYALAFLSLAAGAAKLLKMPQEVELFANAGLGLTALLLLGALQAIGSILSVIPRSSLFGIGLVIVGFAISVLVVSLTGQLGFAAVSTVPVLASVALFLALKSQP